MADTNPKDLTAEVERCKAAVDEATSKLNAAGGKLSKAREAYADAEADLQKAYEELTAAADAAISYYEAFKH